MPQPLNRDIFRYWNSARDVAADPLAVYRRLVLALDGDPNSFLEDWNAACAPKNAPPDWRPNPEDAKRSALAEERLMEAARLAFPMPPFDEDTGEGGQDADYVAALTGLFDFFKRGETNGASPPISPPVDS